MIALAQSDATKAAYAAATDEARALKLFGAPSFVVRGEVRSEVFWGDDRLDDALAWHKRGRLG